MFLGILLFVLLGIGLGIVIGLLPGAHINNILPLVLSLSFLINSPHYLAVFIVSMAVTQIFISYIPSIFLGAPDESTALSVLPGHRLLLEGRGYEAIRLIVIGGIGALITSLIFISIFAKYFVNLYELSRPYIQYVIILVVFVMLLMEKKLKKILSATLIMAISGIFGILVLNSALVPQQNVLFPVLSGLFGLSTIILSVSQRANIPRQQEDSKIQIKNIELIKSILLGSIAGIIVGFLPAIGVSQAATMVQYLGGAGDARSFLISLSGINVANEVFSLNSLFLVNNPRSGASVAIQRVLTELNLYDVLLLTGVICFVSGIAALLALYLGRKVPKILAKLNYKLLSYSIIIFITAMVTILTGIYGLLILFTSTSIGMLCAYLEIRRSHCMGVLLIPSILFFSGVSIALF